MRKIVQNKINHGDTKNHYKKEENSKLKVINIK